MERRELLYGGGSVLAIAVAGCTGRAEDGNEETTDEGEKTTEDAEGTDEGEGTAGDGEDEHDEDGSDDEKEDEGGADGVEADFDGDVEDVSGFDASGFSVGGDALTVDWMVCEEGVLVVNAVVDTTRTDLFSEIESVPVEDVESISAEDVDSVPMESLESMPVEEIEERLMEIVEPVPMDTVESIDDVEQFGTDIREVRFTLCDETGTELLSFTIDVQWMLDVVNDLMTDEELVSRVRETVEYLVDDDELVASVLEAAENTETDE